MVIQNRTPVSASQATSFKHKMSYNVGHTSKVLGQPCALCLLRSCSSSRYLVLSVDSGGAICKHRLPRRSRVVSDASESLIRAVPYQAFHGLQLSCRDNADRSHPGKVAFRRKRNDEVIRCRITSLSMPFLEQQRDVRAVYLPRQRVHRDFPQSKARMFTGQIASSCSQ